MQKRKLILVASAGILFATTTVNLQQKEQNFEKAIFDGMRTFAHVLQITNERHYRVQEPENCINESIKSFLQCLDPHSTFLDQKTYKRMLESTRGEFYGVGVVIDNTRTEKDKTLLIIDTIPDGPSDREGIHPLDKIIEIDGEILEGMSTETAMSKLKGERNSQVTIKVIREGKSDLLSFTITRDVVKEQNSLCFYLPHQNVYYLSLTMFNENSVKQIEELLKKAKKQSYKALILDLRNNTGGLLMSAVDIIGLFLPQNSLVVSTKNKLNEEIERFTTKRIPLIDSTVPIFILINNYTASAAEILAGCLKIHSDQHTDQSLMIFLVGIPTFGKGSVQEIIPIGHSAAIKITTSLYFMPDNTSIQGKGIIPDFEVEKTFPPTEQTKWFKKFYGKERTLTNYIKQNNDTEDAEKDEKTKNKDTKTMNWADRSKKILEEDNQLRAAVSLANIFSLAQSCCPKKVATRAEAIVFMSQMYVADKPLSLIEIKK